ncbi:MAG: hypothetical protein AAF743_02000 [Planctomycetota bacterium]
MHEQHQTPAIVESLEHRKLLAANADGTWISSQHGPTHTWENSDQEIHTHWSAQFLPTFAARTQNGERPGTLPKATITLAGEEVYTWEVTRWVQTGWRVNPDLPGDLPVRPIDPDQPVRPDEWDKLFRETTNVVRLEAPSELVLHHESPEPQPVGEQPSPRHEPVWSGMIAIHHHRFLTYNPRIGFDGVDHSVTIRSESTKGDVKVELSGSEGEEPLASGQVTKVRSYSQTSKVRVVAGEQMYESDNGTGVFVRISRTGPSHEAIEVPLTVTGTATFGSDYTTSGDYGHGTHAIRLEANVFSTGQFVEVKEDSETETEQDGTRVDETIIYRVGSGGGFIADPDSNTATVKIRDDSSWAYSEWEVEELPDPGISPIGVFWEGLENARVGFDGIFRHEVSHITDWELTGHVDESDNWGDPASLAGDGITIEKASTLGTGTELSIGLNPIDVSFGATVYEEWSIGRSISHTFKDFHSRDGVENTIHRVAGYIKRHSISSLARQYRVISISKTGDPVIEPTGKPFRYTMLQAYEPDLRVQAMSLTRVMLDEEAVDTNHPYRQKPAAPAFPEMDNFESLFAEDD